MSQQQNSTDISEFIAENFGANATYVEGLLSRFRNDPALVDESWRAYFTELLDGAQTQENGRAQATTSPRTGSGDGGASAGGAAAPRTAPTTNTTTAPAAATAAPARQPAPAETVENATPIRGGALKIVENMEASLSVPTATSNRRVPVKVLDENRRTINKHLQETGRGKVSYTHIVAWAIVRALEAFPQLNDGFEVVNGQPSRVRRENVNLGVAIDIAKKDGSRTLLVPNIKNANSMRFSQFLAAYDDVVKRAREGKLQIPDFQGTTIS
ncbi:MAG TPA: 2-oxo acid dehydrogenase subunit E2, partial [Pyrinomonadaceae bacterium]|nr:2-oxo acid dehydrogenase subunit E2 [Pyrinomonadaceae bacterium]